MVQGENFNENRFVNWKPYNQQNDTKYVRSNFTLMAWKFFSLFSEASLFECRATYCPMLVVT